MESADIIDVTWGHVFFRKIFLHSNSAHFISALLVWFLSLMLNCGFEINSGMHAKRSCLCGHIAGLEEAATGTLRRESKWIFRGLIKFCGTTWWLVYSPSGCLRKQPVYPHTVLHLNICVSFLIAPLLADFFFSPLFSNFCFVRISRTENTIDCSIFAICANALLSLLW